MPADATSEGSIVAHLRLDISDWEAKVSLAEQKARDLGRVSPHIRVSAETADAIAKLRAVEAAAAAAGGDHVSHVTTVTSSVGGGGGEDFTGATVGATALAEAITRLDAAMAALDADQAADTASQAALNEELRQGSIQSLKESLNMEALAAAERNAAAGAKEKALADIAAANASDKAAAANGNNVSRMGLIVTAVAALIPLLGPLSGYALGVSGALAGMGAAGVLAILGIKNAMADGTAIGNTYAAGLQVLQGDLQKLEQTATSGVLSGFTSAISTINQAMPALNSEIGGFSQQLGTVVDLVMQGVVTGFQVLNPLFVTAGVYIEQIAAGFASWTSNGGLQQFATMAMQYFPQVAQALGSLLQGVMALIDGLAPLGSAMLTVITWAGQLVTVVGDIVGALSGLNPTVFGAIAVGAGAAFAAFKLWGVIAPLISSVAGAVYAATDSVAALGIAIDVAEGPVGWIIAAMAAVGAAFAIAAANTNDATAAANTYAAAVQQDNGAIGENITKQAAANLQKDGAFAAAQKLGISTHTLTQATLSEGAAHDKLVAKLNATIKAHTTLVDTGSAMVNVQDQTAKSAQKVLDSMTSENGGIKAQIKAYNDLAAAVGGTSVKTNAQLQTQTDLAAKYNMTLPAFTAAQGAQQQNAAAALATTQQFQLENDAAGLLKQALDKLNGKALSAADAQNAFDSSLVNMGTHVDKTGKQITFTTTSIGDMSAASVALRGQLNGQVANLEAVVEANGGFANSTGKARDQMVTMRQQIIDNAVAHGVNRDAVTAYIDKLLQIPASVPPTQLQVDDAAALAKIAAVQAALAGLNSNASALQARVNAGQTVANGHTAVYKAAGGAVDAAYLAGGGSPFVPKGTDTKPAMLTPGEFVTKRASAQAYPSFMTAFNDNPTRALQAVQASGASKSSDRPIYMDGSLFGILREMANGEAQIVVNQANAKRKMALTSGRQAGTL